MVRVLQIGKKELDSLVMELGRMLAETIMDMERKERSGPEGKPLHERGLQVGLSEGVHLLRRSEDQGESSPPAWSRTRDQPLYL
ncbi:MAG: hypothetical protein ABSB94_07705 [Syntrophorhabdales bacterium]|jgi:hypothetical protein